MIEDLKQSDLMTVICKWRDIFADDYSFTQTLSQKLYKEYKYLGLHNINAVSKFIHYQNYFLEFINSMLKAVALRDTGIVPEDPY